MPFRKKSVNKKKTTKTVVANKKNDDLTQQTQQLVERAAVTDYDIRLENARPPVRLQQGLPPPPPTTPSLALATAATTMFASADEGTLSAVADASPAARMPPPSALANNSHNLTPTVATAATMGAVLYPPVSLRACCGDLWTAAHGTALAAMFGQVVAAAAAEGGSGGAPAVGPELRRSLLAALLATLSAQYMLRCDTLAGIEPGHRTGASAATSPDKGLLRTRTPRRKSDPRHAQVAPEDSLKGPFPLVVLGRHTGLPPGQRVLHHCVGRAAALIVRCPPQSASAQTSQTPKRGRQPSRASAAAPHTNEPTDYVLVSWSPDTVFVNGKALPPHLGPAATEEASIVVTATPAARARGKQTPARTNTKTSVPAPPAKDDDLSPLLRLLEGVFITGVGGRGGDVDEGKRPAPTKRQPTTAKGKKRPREEDKKALNVAASPLAEISVAAQLSTHRYLSTHRLCVGDAISFLEARDSRSSVVRRLQSHLTDEVEFDGEDDDDSAVSSENEGENTPQAVSVPLRADSRASVFGCGVKASRGPLPVLTVVRRCLSPDGLTSPRHTRSRTPIVFASVKKSARK